MFWPALAKWEKKIMPIILQFAVLFVVFFSIALSASLLIDWIDNHDT